MKPVLIHVKPVSVHVKPLHDLNYPENNGNKSRQAYHNVNYLDNSGNKLS